MRAWIKIAGTSQDFVATAKEQTLDKWHCIPGHVNIWTVKTILKNSLVTRLLIDDKSQELTQCIACIQEKWHVEPFPKEATEKAEKISNLIVSDVWGLAQVEGPAHEKYFYSYMDASARYSRIYFKNTKDEALSNFIVFKEFVKTQTGNKLKKFQSDNGGEYVNKPFKDFCAKNGINMETTAPYLPSQNRIAKHLNQTLLEHACAMIFTKNLLKYLWPKAVAYMNYIRNR